MPLFLIYLFFRFIVQCRAEFYIVWIVDVDWMHLEVGLKTTCWCVLRFTLDLKVKVS
jgi:hypothetical protein